MSLEDVGGWGSPVCELTISPTNPSTPVVDVYLQRTRVVNGPIPTIDVVVDKYVRLAGGEYLLLLR